MAQGPRSDDVAQAKKNQGLRGAGPQLSLIFLSTLILMTLYEGAKTLMFPSISLWTSHLATIAMTAIVATAAAYHVLRKLRHGEESYRRLVETSPEPIWIHQSGTIIFANQPCASLFGTRSPAALVGKEIYEFVHPALREGVRKRVRSQARDSEPVFQNERKMIRADGSGINVEVVICSILYRGRPAALVVFHDVLKRSQAEQKLRESEASLAAAQRIARLGSWTAELTDPADMEKNTLRWSDEMFRIFGYEVGRMEVSRAAFFRAVHPADREYVRETAAKALQQGTGFSVEYRIIRPDGSERTIQGHVDIAFDEITKRPLRLIGTVQDITDRKQAEEKLAQFALIVESSSDAISSVALDGKIVSWNKGAESLYGYTAIEALGQPITIISPKERPGEIEGLLGRLRKGERIPAFETVRLRKDGQPIDVSLTISPVWDPAGNIIGTAAVARDITARKREEERSRRLAQVVDSATEFISTGDTEGRVTFMNRAFLRSTGRTEEEVLGKYFRDVVLSPNNPPGLHKEILAGSMKTEGWKGECLHRHKDGADFPVYLSVGPLKDSQGRVIGNVGVVRDLTESKRAEERFYKAFHLNPEPITLATLSEGRYLDVNESFLRIAGYRREEVIGRTSLELKFWQHVEDRAKLIGPLQQQGSVRDLEITFRTKSGEQRVALDSADIIELNGQ